MLCPKITYSINQVSSRTTSSLLCLKVKSVFRCLSSHHTSFHCLPQIYQSYCKTKNNSCNDMPYVISLYENTVIFIKWIDMKINKKRTPYYIPTLPLPSKKDKNCLFWGEICLSSEHGGKFILAAHVACSAIQCCQQRVRMGDHYPDHGSSPGNQPLLCSLSSGALRSSCGHQMSPVTKSQTLVSLSPCH